MNPINRQTQRLSFAGYCCACAGAVMLGLSGCATTPPKVESEYNRAVNFAGYRTFAVLEPRASGPGTDPGAAMRMTQPAMQAVREAMTAKGLTESPIEQATCIVRVRGQSVANVEITNWGYTPYPYGARRAGWGYSRGYRDIDVRQTTALTLIVEIYDAASKSEAWVGWSEHSGDSQMDPDKLKEAIRNILAEFPPSATTQ